MRLPFAADSVTAQRVRFAAGFVLVAGVLFALYTFPYEENGISERWFEDYLAFYARAAGFALHQLDSAVSVHGSDILGRYPLRIVKNCDAIEVNILFASAVLAFPTSWRRRALGLLLGLPALIALNITRICSLYFIGVASPDSFELFHLEVWPLVLVACAALLFMGWANWTERLV
jgi:exosortase/archaeosortase family protein